MSSVAINYQARLLKGSNRLQIRNNGEMEDAVKKMFEQG